MTKAPPGPRSGFGKERTAADYAARIEWESWAARTARAKRQEAVAQAHDMARKAYEREFEKKHGVDLTPAPVNYDDWAEHRKRFGLEGAKTKLDLLLDRVKPGKGELTLDVEGYTEAQVERVVSEAKARGLHVSGTDRWLLIRDLSKMHLGDMDVADEIWRQLGRARVMIGAKDPMGDKDSLTFKVGANPKGVKWIKVRLDPSDTYTVRFINRKGLPLHEVDDIYSDNLARVIEMHTGLRTSL